MKNIKKMKKAEIDAANKKFYDLYTVGREQSRGNDIRTPYSHNLVAPGFIVNGPATIIEAIILYYSGNALYTDGDLFESRISSGTIQTIIKISEITERFSITNATDSNTLALGGSISTFDKTERASGVKHVLQSRKGRTRSFVDLVCFVNTYVPAHYLEIYNILQNMSVVSFGETTHVGCSDFKTISLIMRGFSGGYCPTIGRPILMTINSFSGSVSTRYHSKEECLKNLLKLMRSVATSKINRGNFDFNRILSDDSRQLISYRAIHAEWEALEGKSTKNIFVTEVDRAKMYRRMLNI